MKGTAETRPATKRLTASERESLVRMNVALEILTQEPASLADRSSMIPGAKRDLAMMASKVTKLMEAYARTIPMEQLSTYMNSLKLASYVVGVKRPGGQYREDKNYGLWLPNEVINGLLAGCHDHCMMCDMDKSERKCCSLRKTLDVIPNDVKRREDGDCPYYAVI